MIKTSHLIGYYPFEGNANDASGNNNSGIVYGASLVKGKFGQCYSFDGVDDYIEIPLNSFPDSMYDITISFWAKVNQDTNFILLGNPDNDSYNRLNIHLPWNTNIYWDFGDIHSTGRLYTTWDSTWYDTWAHWVFISDSNVGQKIYRNGILLASDLTTSYFRKETRSLYLGTYYRGLIEQFQIYDKALSQLDIRRVMLGFHPFGLQFNGYYKFCSYTTSAENQSADIKLSLPANKKITIFWGDGTSTVVTGEVDKVIYSHTYTDIKTYILTVTGDYNDITYLMFNCPGSINTELSILPKRITSLNLYSNNTTSGNIVSVSYLTLFQCLGACTVTGDLKDASRYLTFLACTGLNTLYGDLASLPDDIFYLWITGYNTISEYTGKTWTTNMSMFRIIPVSPGGLSSSEMDQLIIDLDTDLDWSGGGQIILTGANEPPTGIGQAAIDNIVAEGGTVIVND